jgi:hypothetical protein
MDDTAAKKSVQALWWLAINGSSCTLCPVPMKHPTTRPRAQQLIGFPTREEAVRALEIATTAPMDELERYFRGLGVRARKGEIRSIEPDEPEPSTREPTAWLEAGEDEAVGDGGFFRTTKRPTDEE